jgi:F-type H+-transporting ATPase subunit delta
MSRRIARPYATALFKVMEKQGVPALREVEQELDTIARVLQAQPDLLRAFEIPAVPPVTKQKILQAIGKAVGLRVETQRLLAALEQHYRLRFMPDVVAAFRGLVDRVEGVTRGMVELPTAPSAEQLAALAAALSTLAGARVELESKVRPELLAGFVARVGSRVYDGSVQTQLRRFAREGGRAQGERHADQG